MQYDFDEVIDRQNTNAFKIDGLKTIYGREDLIPLWVADMDFRTPSFIVEALRRRCEHEILGYTVCPKDWYVSVAEWLKKQYGWAIERKKLGFIPGVVPGLALAVKCFTRQGDKVMIQPPVYYPFFSIVEQNNRKLVFNPLQLENGQYKMNFEQMREDIKGCKLFILCSPHNPGGRVWSKEELTIVADICAENGVMVFSDEIHADLTFPAHKHTPFALASEKAAANSIIFMSPSKAFNMPGLGASYYITENREIYSVFNDYLESIHLNNCNIFAFAGIIAAYSNGTDWLDQMLAYVQENIDFLGDYIQENIPEIKIIQPQASFLVFLDCRKFGLSQKELVTLFVDKAHLALNNGAMFGEKEGTGFMRINVACSRSILAKALQQLKEAVDEWRMKFENGIK